MAIVINGSGTVTGISVGGLPDSIVDSGTLADNAVGLAQMAGGTDGNVITYDTSGNPAVVATGSSGQVLTSAGAGAAPTMVAGGKVLTITQGVRTAELDVASDSWVTLTSLTATVTPVSSSSRFLVTVHLCGVGKHSSLVQGHLRLQQSISGGADSDFSFSRSSASLVSDATDSHDGTSEGIAYLWSPNTTSAVTYNAQTKRHSGAGTYRINSNTGANDVRSTITVMEIGG